MMQKITIAVENTYVARWFVLFLREYSIEKEVNIHILILRQKKIRQRNGNRLIHFWEKNLFKPLRLNDYFQSTTSTIEGPTLFFSSGHTLNPDLNKGDAVIYSIQNGHLFTRGGLKGLWHFFYQFFLLGDPMVLLDEVSKISYSIFFQTRDFTLRRNIGYLKYNLEKIFARLLAGTPHRFPATRSDDFVRNRFLESVRYAAWQFFQKFRRKVLNSRWHLVRMHKRSIDAFCSKGETVIPLTSGDGWADPFFADSEKGLFLFFEEIIGKKGRISVAELNKDSLTLTKPPVTVLEKSTHMSYPFVFQIEDVWYMIPENSGANDVSIYKAQKFPYIWKHFKTVFDGEKWVDTTPFYFNSRWWIFSVHKSAPYASSYQELYLFYCDNILTDKWISHPGNPVVSDVRHARPGGPLFFHNQKLYRPAQNCLNKYGGGLKFCEVIALSETEYEERVTGEFRFPWNKRMSSFHTIGIYKDKMIGDCSL